MSNTTNHCLKSLENRQTMDTKLLKIIEGETRRDRIGDGTFKEVGM
jgi:hypothetical protein